MKLTAWKLQRLALEWCHWDCFEKDLTIANFGNFSILDGIVPCNLLFPKYNSSNNDRFPREIGNLPESLLSFKYNRCNFLRFPILFGIVPVNLLPCIDKVVKLTKLPTHKGISPKKRLLPIAQKVSWVERLTKTSATFDQNFCQRKRHC